ncbi:hypothetical protein J5X84_38005 [Streptosporangiaceae bacterium NEAU-GS5]|nr:hypothetical protein [Streptosporangiaceae bacterium NEAU-GS5]
MLKVVYVPPEWPTAVRRPDVPDWEVSAATWLLDACPPDYRAYTVLRRHPVTLAFLARLHVDGQIEAARVGFRTAGSLNAFVEPHTRDEIQEVLRREGPRLVALAASIAAVEHALRGGTFTEQIRPDGARRIVPPSGDGPPRREPRARFFPRN